MARFRFQFEAVLRVRKSREDEVLRALGMAQRAYQLEISRKGELLGALDQSLIRREQLGFKAVSPEAFCLEQDFITGTKQRIIQADQAIYRASKLVEKGLRAYLNARKQSRMLETVREKSYAEFRREQAKREQRNTDDLTVMRFRMLQEAGTSQTVARFESEETA